LLGTFVEVTATGLSEERLQRAVNAAFAVVERIQRLMSAHDPDSELSLLNREAARRPITVSRETFAVLRRAGKLSAESGGAFDCTIAPTLAGWGLLPASLQRQERGGWRQVLLRRGGEVFFLQPLALDLGGIAKGFAVDSAIEVLRYHGVVSAVVNAGGDLRVFGPQAATVHLRHPANPHRPAHRLELSDAALATSSPCFTEREYHGRLDSQSKIQNPKSEICLVSHLVNPRDHSAITGHISVTVRARECWLADGLTKVVLNAPALAERLLAKYEAEAFMLAA